MGIIIDGTAAVLFNGPLLKFEKAIVALRDLNDKSKGLKIDTVQLPESAAVVVRMQFQGTMSECEIVMAGLETLRAKVGIDTVPLPESPAIGTWPTPEPRATHPSWAISATTSAKRKRRQTGVLA